MKDIKTDITSDEELFALYKKKGNDKYFRELYDRYSKKVYAYCMRAVPDAEAARDVYQKTWATIVEKKESFTGGSFIAWLMVITRNNCLMAKRTMKYTDEITENTLVADDFAKNDFKLKEILMNKIKSLPDEMAEIILLKYYDEFSYKEIADVLNIEMSLVKVRLFRAKKLLSKSLAFLKENRYE